MRTIHKYQLALNVDGVQMLSIPIGAKIVHCMLQGNNPCIWADVDTEETEQEIREFIIIATGQSLDPYKYADTIHKASIHTLAGEFVFHVFELEELHPRD